MNANFDQLRHIISLKKNKDFQAMAGWLPFRAKVAEKMVKQLMTIITQNSLKCVFYCHSAIYCRLGFENTELFVSNRVSGFENAKPRFQVRIFHTKPYNE